MKDDSLTDDMFHGPGAGIELALPGDTIRRRHVATRASNRRRIIVLVVGDAEFEGYSIGIDSQTLQVLELPSGEVSSIALEHIIAITDSKPFTELTKEEKDTVDRRTASFRKTSQTWLVKNWPAVYDRRDDDEERPAAPPRQPVRRPPYTRTTFAAKYGQPTGESNHGDSEVRHGAGEDGDQARGQRSGDPEWSGSGGEAPAAGDPRRI